MKKYEVKAEPIYRETSQTIGIKVALCINGAQYGPLSKITATMAMLLWVTKRHDIVKDLKTTNKYDLVDRYKKEFLQDQKDSIDYMECITTFSKAQQMISMVNNHIEFTVLDIAAEQ